MQNPGRLKLKRVSFNDEIDMAPSPVDRTSAILFEYNTTTYVINEAAAVDHRTAMKVQDPRMSLSDVAQIRAAFNAVDTNRNGYIEMSELRLFLKQVSQDSLPRGMATTIMKEADRNKDGVLSFDEFFRLCESHDWLTMSFIKHCNTITGFDAARESEGRSYEHYYTHSRIFPLVIYTVTIIQIIFYINDQLHIWSEKSHHMVNSNEVSKFHEAFSSLSTTFLYNADRKIELWRFLTYMMVHADFGHVASNLFLLLAAGIPLEVIHGSRCLLLIYFVSGLFGAIAVASITNCKILVGSSAGAFGLLAAHMSTLILNWSEMHYKMIRILIISVFIIVNSFLCLYSTIRLGSGLTSSTISHVSGFLMGLLIGILTLKNVKVLEYEKQLRKVVKMVTTWVILGTIGLVIWLPSKYKI